MGIRGTGGVEEGQAAECGHLEGMRIRGVFVDERVLSDEVVVGDLRGFGKTGGS